jgi:hypothetical protein
MRGTRRGLWLLLTVLVLWAIGGHVFYRIDEAYDRQGFGLMADLVEHKRKLADATPGPRILVAGGSNAYYGVDSQILQREVGLPVVNFAFPSGAYDDRINLHLVEGVVRSGDVVLYAASGFWNIEDAVERRSRGFDSYLVARKLPGYERRFDGSSIPWQARPKSNTLLLAMFESVWPRPPGRPWTVDTDERGDFTGCVPAPVVLPQPFDSDDPNPDLTALVATAAERIAAKGGRLVAGMPWLFINERDRSRWAYFGERVVGQYAAHHVPVIAAPADVLLRSARRDFCDSPLHLSTEVVRLRSQQLAGALQRYVMARRAGAEGPRSR